MAGRFERLVRMAVGHAYPASSDIVVLDATTNEESEPTGRWLVRVRFRLGDLTRIEQVFVTLLPPDVAARDEALSAALSAQGIAVPPVWMLEPADVGVHLVRQYVSGVPLTQLLIDASMRWELTAHGFSFARTLARIHNIDWRAALPWMADPESLPEDLVASQLDSWYEEWQQRATHCPEQYRGDVEAALAWIDDSRPDEVSVALCHGDYWPGNVIMADDDVAAIVGWEHALVTDVSFDLCLIPFEIRQMRVPDEDAQLLAQAIFGSYLQSSVRSLGNLQFFAVVRLLDAGLTAVDAGGRSTFRVPALRAETDILFSSMRQAMSGDRKALWDI